MSRPSAQEALAAIRITEEVQKIFERPENLGKNVTVIALAAVLAQVVSSHLEDVDDIARVITGISDAAIFSAQLAVTGQM